MERPSIVLAAGDCRANAYRLGSPVMFDRLVKLVERNPKNYHHELKSSSQYAELLKWVEASVQKLADPFYKLSTKCAWILRGIEEFPACATCGHVFSDRNVSVRNGYSRFCSAKCNCSNEETIRKSQAKKLAEHGSAGWNNPAKSRMTRYAANDGKWEKPDTGSKRRATNIKQCGFGCNLQSEESKAKSRETNLARRGVEYSMQDPKVTGKAVATKNRKYGNGRGDPSHFTYVPTPERAAKNVATCMRLYGVPNGGASAEAQFKIHARYTYCGKSFDSGPELAFEIWLNNNNIVHSYRDGSYVEYAYEYGGKSFTCRYYYDFRLACGLIVEIKGRHLMDKNMKLINPYADTAYKRGRMPRDVYLKITAKYAAKQACMEKNHVVVLTNESYKIYEDYVSLKYGKGYIKQFRNAKSLG